MSCGGVTSCVGVIDGKVRHVMIVTEVQAPHPTAQHQVHVCGHTNDRLNYDLKHVDSFYGPKNVEYWSVARSVRNMGYGSIPDREQQSPAVITM
jgi:hypothetical protein